MSLIVSSLEMFQDRDNWLAAVRAVVNLRGYKKWGGIF